MCRRIVHLVSLVFVGCLWVSMTHAQVLSGMVVDGQGEPVSDAFCKAAEEVVMTNGQGKFRFEGLEGLDRVVLVVSHVGFEGAQQEATLPNLKVLVVLNKTTETLQEAVIRSDADRPHEATVVDIRELDVQALDAIPAASRIQALKSVAGVHMMSAGPGMLRPVLRGLSGLRVATLFLNARVESQAWGEGHGIFFPEQGVSRMDVVRGPEVLQHGPDAYGGVLKVVPTGPLAEVGRLTQLSLTGHSNTGGFQGSVMTQKRSAKAHHVILSGVNRFGEYTLPSREQASGSALRQFYSQGRFGYLRDWGTWEGAYSSCYNTAGIVGTGGTEQSGDHMLTLGAQFRTGLWNWHPTLSYQLNHRKELDVVGPDSLNESNELAYTRLDLSLRSTRVDLRTSRSGNDGWDWTLGGQGYSKTNTNDSLLIAQSEQLIPDADIFGGGIYAKVSHDAGAWVPSASVRGDIHGLSWLARPALPVASDLASGGDRTYAMVSGALGAKWRANETNTFGVHVLRGNRAPGLAELLAYGNHHDSFREERGDPDLGLETSHSVELQWVKAPRNGWSGDVAIYSSHIANYMMLVPNGEVNATGLPVQFHQATEARLNGMDFNALYVPQWAPKWSLRTALSVVDSRNREGAELPWTPPPSSRWELRRAWGSSSVVAGMTGLVLEASRDAVLWHASTSVEWGTGLRVNAQVINVTNQAYIPTLSLLRNLGIQEPGTNVRIQIVQSF